VRKLSIGLGEDFRSRSFVVRQPVIVVGILVAIKISAGFAFYDPMTFTKGFIIAFQGISLNQPRAVRLNAHLPFLARIARHDDLYRQIHHGTKHRVRDTCVT
jgi:hypothetical protein